MKATDDYLITAIAVLMAYIAGDIPASPLRDKLERAADRRSRLRAIREQPLLSDCGGVTMSSLSKKANIRRGRWARVSRTVNAVLWAVGVIVAAALIYGVGLIIRVVLS